MEGEMKAIPEFLQNMLIKQYGEAIFQKILAGYGRQRAVTLRVNTLKSDIDSVKHCLEEGQIVYQEVPWSQEALIVDSVRENDIRVLPAYDRGEVYLQSLSSMLPPVFLLPKEGESILDMAAAPGGKTTQMAALSGGKAQITACEKNKIRAERLNYNIEKQGASNVYVMVTDSRKLDDFFSFDKILLDAPCSGSGTLKLGNQGLKPCITKELIVRSAKTQEELLRKALKLLKPGHEMIYSTCSILEEENEKILERVLGKRDKIVPLLPEMVPQVPLLPTKISGTLCVCPDRLYEGFFVAKIRKG